MPTVDDRRTWRVAVIPTRGNRPDVLARCLSAVVPQVHLTIVVDNSDDGHIRPSDFPVGPIHVLHDPEQPPNLSRLWNLGLRAANHWASQDERAHTRTLYTAVLNDDAIVPPYWFDELEAAMESSSAAAGGYNGDMIVHRTPGTTALHQRLPGHAFLLRANAGIEADENLRWWCGDNDIDMQARMRGGTLILPGDPVVHLHPDQSTNGVLAEQAAKDMQTFVNRWGFRPWAI